MRKVFRFALHALLCLPVWLPLVMLCTGAFIGEDEAMIAFGPVLSGTPGLASWPIIPKYPTLQPYVALLLDSPEFFAMFWNSAAYAALILAGQMLVAAPAAWALGRYRFPLKGAVNALYIALMLMPFQVTLVAQFIALDAYKLLDTRWAIVLPAAFSTFPVFIMTKFFQAIPESMVEAAQLDGAGPLRTFVYVGAPMGTPGLLSALVLGFFECWSMIEQPMTLLRNPALWPLSLYLPQIHTASLGKSLAASVIVLMPALLLFLYGQQYLEQGISAMGIKE